MPAFVYGYSIVEVETDQAQMLFHSLRSEQGLMVDRAHAAAERISIALVDDGTATLSDAEALAVIQAVEMLRAERHLVSDLHALADAIRREMSESGEARGSDAET